MPIIGVTSPEFFGVEVGRQFGVAMPNCASGNTRRDHWWLAAIGRLKPGWTAAQAQAHLQGILPDVQRAAMPDYRADWQALYRRWPCRSWTHRPAYLRCAVRMRGRCGS